MFHSYIILWNTLYSTKINDVRIEHRAVTIKGSVDGQNVSMTPRFFHRKQMDKQSQKNFLAVQFQAY